MEFNISSTEVSMKNVKTELKYPDLFAALGKFIENKKLQNVCVMEFEEGIIITGSQVYEASRGPRRRLETIVLSREDLQKLVIPAKRGFLNR